MIKKLFTLIALALCSVGAAWADETTDTFSLTTYTVTDSKYTATSTDGNVTLTLNNPGGADSKNRGFRWQNGKGITIELASGYKIDAVTLTSNKNGNVGKETTTYTLTDGTASLSGSWDNEPLETKQETYTWTATTGTSYSTWVATNTSASDIYIASITVKYEEASTTNAAPTILTQPSSTTGYVGFETSLSVAASGYPSPTYQWYSNTTASNEGGTAIEGATSSSYTFTPTATGTYYYYAVATNNYDEENHSATTDVATVTVTNKYLVTYDAGSSGATVSVPLASTYYEGGTSITLPSVNRYFYLEGKSVSKWSDGTNEYDLGATYTVNADVTFQPIFADNTTTLGNEEATITWTFSRDDGAPLYTTEGNGKTTNVISTTSTGIDLNMEVSLYSGTLNSKSAVGKFNNSSYTNRAQVNAFSSFIIPAIQGMTVTYTGTSGTASTSDAIYFGSDNATSVSGSTYSYTYSGTESTLTIKDEKGGSYPSGITVTYPAQGVSATVNSYGYATLYSSQALDFSGVDGLTAYTVTLSEDKTSASLTAVSDVPANTGVILKGTANTTYSIPVASASTTAQGDLTGSTTDTNADGTQYILYQDADNDLGFYNATSGTTIAAGKAYLVISGTAAKSFITIGESTTTGINAIENTQSAIGKSAPAYNLAGQKVSGSYKGIVIQNGKKYIQK